jgi:predicted amidophosphoribosyltransferase
MSDNKKIYCSQCGSEITPEDEFCSECGKRLLLDENYDALSDEEDS